MTKNTNLMLTFRYKGISKSGQKLLGTIQAKSMAIAKVDLIKQGVIIHKISKKRTSFLDKENRSITAVDIAVFSRQLATMIESGIPLVQSFDIIAKGQTHIKLKKLIDTVKGDLETGLTLAEALAKHPNYFNSLYCNLVDAGEKSGSLDIMLNKISAYKEQIETIKKKIKKALTYPIAVFVVALMVTAGLLIFVVPQFESLFKGFGANLPALTQAIVTMSQFVQMYWYIILGSLVAAVYAFVYANTHSIKFAQRVDKILLKLSIIGTIIEKAAIARFSRTLSITFAAGLPLVEALKSVAGTTGTSIFNQATEKIRDQVATGHTLCTAMEQTRVFPNMVVQMVAVGEESGSLEKMLTKVADFYEEEVNNAIDMLSSLLEPIIMCLLGVLVGGLVIAMYLPLFKLGQAI